MKKLTQLFSLFTILFINPTTSFSNYESDLNSWLDSTLVAESIQWEETETAFFKLAKQLFKKNKSVENILQQISNKYSKSKQYFDPPKGDYEHLTELSAISADLFKKLEVASFDLVKKHNQWENLNSGTRLSLYFNHINYWGCHVFTPKVLSSKLISLRTFIDNEELADKVCILTLVQKIFKQNNYRRQKDLAKNDYRPVTRYNKDNQSNTSKNNEEEPLNFVQNEPSFIGGQEGMQFFIVENICYPDLAIEMGEQEIIYVQFIISEDGSIDSPLIRKGESEILSKEAIRVIQSMPAWKPGMQDGQTVRVKFTIPIHFKL